ncbi:hypothetical protein [Pseudoalteromonas sp. S3431]|uniref:hypothetical protein n=1 Tax=Pseudoalteromonas sp. S3431 TaxID=579537 RepID=UPI0004A0EA20|nr:hypothetical protein [Pseudoalteromonas sp. S3431]KDC53939.1 hypothetical protein DO88_11600 [Pseudoalteromonas sp. S3431]
MSAFSVSIDYLSMPATTSVDELLYGDVTAALEGKKWQSWDVCIYDCIVKSKELINKVEDFNTPLVWLLPALSYQSELKQLLESSLKQLYPDHVEHLLFYGVTSAHVAVALTKKNHWKKVNIIALDATFKADASGQYSYQGVGGAFATLGAKKTGWSQVNYEITPSIDFVKHNQLNGMFTRVAEQAQQSIDIIFAPGNGINHDSEVWLNDLQLLSALINEQTHYELPNYKLGQIGALEGVVNLYQLATSPVIENHCKHALMISQEQAKHQAVASYLWISEEAHN